MAQDLIELMARLGHQRFCAVGHDRGGYVVQRLGLDHPQAVDRIAVLGDVPIGEALARCNARFAQQWWHWFFIGHPAPLAERLIAADVDAWYDLAELYDNDVLSVWGPWATELSGYGLDSAHHIAEEAPQELVRALLTFFGHTVR
jgi:pimeloyl-ACP methyl ester carboxylesterase